jgi:hypothetical protein
MTRRRGSVPAVLLTLALVLTVAACGSDSGTSGQSADVDDTQAVQDNGLPPADPAQQLPPNDVVALRALYNPVLEPMGLTLTRGELIDLSNDGYEPSDTGTHLALYVEPTGPYTDAQYVEGFWDVASLVTPDVFARWSGLVSYDICQEPLPADDDRATPFPVTQVNLTRAAAETIDWENGSLADLIVASRENRDIKIVVNRDLRSTPEYQAVLDEAGDAASTATTAGS